MHLAERMSAIPPYIFATVEQRIRQKEAQGSPVINFGAGSPDLPPPDWITDRMVEASRVASSHRYPSYTGAPALRRAWAAYYAARFSVTLDPDTEVLPLIGSKEGVAHVALALVDPGDLVLVPDPGYPTYVSGTLLAGGTPYPLPLLPENGFLPDLDAISPDVLERAVALWLNYPNNPTGAVAPLAFYERAVALAKQYNFAILSDNPYAEITYGDYRAPSLLEVPGAKEVAIEINSVSKTYNMAGWRVGAAVGNATLINALMRVKSNMDTGIFYPLQAGTIAALTGDQSWIHDRNAVYQRRRDMVVAGLRAAGWSVESPQAALYVWPRVPEGHIGADLALRLLDECAVWITPGEAFGEAGRGFMRLSLCVPEDQIAEAMARIAQLMA